MNDDRILYTGQLTYKDIDFTFVFDGEKLKLIPPKNKIEEIEEQWFSTPLGNGGYCLNKRPKMEDGQLFGICNELGKQIIFLTQCGAYISVNDNHIFSLHMVLTINIIAYVTFKYPREFIDRVSFNNPEIDAIHPINESFDISLNKDFKEFSQNGVMSLTTKDFHSTTTKPQTFLVDDKIVTGFFAVQRGISKNVCEPPLSLHSNLMFEFEPINDYEFIFRLWHIAKDFLSYLCYRKDVYLPTVKLYAPYTGGKHEEFAAMHIIGENKDTSITDIKGGRYIKQELIAEHEGQILEDIASGLLYLRHIPSSYKSGRQIDAARFIMIVTAFEWEFKRLYPDGVRKSNSTILAEKEAMKAIEDLFQNSHGKLKNKYRYLKKHIKDDSLKSKIEQVGTDLTEVITPFGNYLYSSSEEHLEYSQMGQRLSDQRNNFAHGNLDKEFINLSLWDLVFLEYIVYAIQLKYYSIDEQNIHYTIKDLFRCGAIY